LTCVLAHLEAAIDFPDENLPPETEDRIFGETAALAAEIERHLADGHRGERLRDGIMVAIIGPPNAGKSSLLNKIVRREAVITSPIAGTTRDIVEVAVDLQGYPVVLADTAGLRDSDDVVEQEGLRRALRRAEEAEIRLFVFDAACPDQMQAAAAWPGPDTILVANKIDLLRSPEATTSRAVMPGLDPGILGDTSLSRGMDAHGTSPWAEGPRIKPGHDKSRTIEKVLPISALTGEGVHGLLSMLGERVAQTYRIEGPILTRARHRQAVEDAVAALRRALEAPLPELRAEDLRLALRSLGHITGTVDVEDLLDVIFRDFCIGK